MTPQGVSFSLDPFVVLASGAPALVDPNDDKTPVGGDLLVNTTVKGIAVKSGLQLLL